MKKNIIKIGVLSLLISGTASLSGCQDAIDIIQDGEINSDVFYSNVRNMSDFLQGGVYRSCETAQSIYFTSVITDEVRTAPTSGGQNFNEHRLIIDNSTGFASNIWLQNYSLINNTTRLIEGAKKVTPQASEVETYNNVIAQARTLRAFAYLQLQTYYSENMADNNALGVMIVKEVPNIGTKLPRSTNAEVYEAIETDLALAEPHLPQSGRYYASKDLVNAIRARLYIYRGIHSEAKKYAQLVVDRSGLQLTPALPIPAGEVGSKAWNDEFYKDASVSPYRSIWSDNIQGEVIFALARPETGGNLNIGSYYNTNQSDIKGYPYWGIGRNLFNILESTEGDIRRYTYLDPTSQVDKNYETSPSPFQTDRLIIDKYPGKGSAALRNDLKVFRLSEIYFILAECAVAENDLVTANQYIQKVREARNYLGKAVTPVYNNEKEALADILKERRVELAFEGHRYIDLKRLAEKAGVSMDRNRTDDATGVVVENLPNGDYRYTLPIPLSELAGNPNLKQNRGY